MQESPLPDGDTALVYAFLIATETVKNQKKRGQLVGMSQQAIALWIKAFDRREPVSIRAQEDRQALLDYLLLGDHLPGFREGVAFALDAMREPFDLLTARLATRLESGADVPIESVEHGLGPDPAHQVDGKASNKPRGDPRR